MPFSRDLPDSGNESSSLISPALAGRFFTTSATWEAYQKRHMLINTTFKELFEASKRSGYFQGRAKHLGLNFYLLHRN